MEKNNVIKTDYGYDVVWTDNEYYCSKILIFEEEGKQTRLHFHKDKHKSWFVNAGKFEVQWVDPKDGKAYSKELPEGSIFEVPALLPVTLKKFSLITVLWQKLAITITQMIIIG